MGHRNVKQYQQSTSDFSYIFTINAPAYCTTIVTIVLDNIPASFIDRNKHTEKEQLITLVTKTKKDKLSAKGKSIYGPQR